MYKFGSTSNRRLNTCHPALQKIMRRAIETAPMDFGVVCGFRGMFDQNQALASGKSRAAWGESDHNFQKGDKPCSMAVDVAPYSAEINNYLWHDKEAFAILAEHITTVAQEMGYKLEWGGDYHSIKDRPHYSLIP